MARTDAYRRDPHGCGGMRLSTETVATLTDTGTWYKLDTNVIDGQCIGWTLDLSGKLTFNGRSGTEHLFVGNANIKANKTCEINFALFINGVRQEDITTPATFEHANSYNQLSANRIIEFDKDDYVEVYANSDTASTELTIAYFSISLWGV